MSFLSNLFGRSKKNLHDSLSPATPEEKPLPEPIRGGTTLRKQEDGSPEPQKKAGPELSALEMAERQSWQVKSLPVWKPGEKILGLYRVEDVLEGGMGRVYIAHHKNWNIKLAIKSPNEMMLSDRNNFARVLREANSWTELGLHPNIAYCYYVRSIEDVPHIFVEYVDGGNLRQWIAEGKCIDYRVSLDLAIQFCHGMEHAHSKGMIHRDIKPENVLMTQDGVLKITDFGLVRSGAVIGGENGKAGLSGKGMTRIGDVMGTEGFMAPEQFTDAAGVDERADIFSMGVCFYEMFCGNLPYGRVSYIENSEPPDPVVLSGDKKFPTSLGKILKKSIQWEREARFGNIKEVRTELCDVYRFLYGVDSVYTNLDVVGIDADGLNNKGVSCLELGRKDEMVYSWQETLRIDPTHLEGTYNYALSQWRNGIITDDEAILQLSRCGENPTVDKTRLKRLLSSLHIERLDSDAALKLLKELSEKEDNLIKVAQNSNITCCQHMEGHTGSVTSVALSEDGKLVLSGSEDLTVRTWETATGRCLKIMEGHADRVTSVALSNDGKLVLSGSDDRTVRTWETAAGRCSKIMEGHTGRVTSVALSEDGKLVLSGSDDRTVRAWETGTGRCLRIMEGHADRVTSVALSNDGKLVLSGSDDRTVRAWETATGRCLRVMEGHTGSVNSVALSENGELALSGSNDETVRLWEMSTGQCRTILKGHNSWVLSVSMKADGRYAVSGGYDDTIRIWELEMNRCIRTIDRHVRSVNSVSVAKDGVFFASGSEDFTILAWIMTGWSTNRAHFALSQPRGLSDIKAQQEMIHHAIARVKALYDSGDNENAYSLLFALWQQISFNENRSVVEAYRCLRSKGGIKDLAFSVQRTPIGLNRKCIYSIAATENGQFAVSGGEEKTVRYWDLDTGRCLDSLKGHEGDIYSVSMSADGQFAISGSQDSTVRLWSLRNGLCLSTMNGHSRDVYSVSMTPDGRFGLSGGVDMKVRLWDLESGRCVRTMHGHTNTVDSVCITQDGKFGLSAGGGAMHIWELETGECLSTIDQHTANATFMSPDGRYALSGHDDGSVKFWDLKSYQCLRTVKEHASSVNTVCLSADGQLAVSGGRDNTVRLWDFKSGRCLRVLKGHDQPVNAVYIDRVGLFAVSAGFDNTMRFWRFLWDLKFSSV